MTEKLIIYSDGGARGNPGPAAVGFVIYDFGHHEIKRLGKYIGTTTNNQAEYRALLTALQGAVAIGAKNIVCNLDSELVVKQLQGLYKIKEKGLQALAAEVLSLTAKFSQVEFKHVRREQNKLADELVNEALDEAGF